MIQMLRSALAAAAVLSLAACGGDEQAEGTDAAAGQQPVAQADSAQPAAQPALPPPELRLEVNIAAREVRVYRNDQQVAAYPVAVGTKEWPTRTGQWTIGQVVWNPRWTPPQDEAWAKDEEVKEPGAADNPLGHAQLVYDPPRSIHGTNEPESVGKAASHGSIRVTNDVAVRLARMVMEAGGAGKDEAWYQRVRANRRERVEVPIPNPIPISVVSGGADSGSGSGGGSSSSADSTGAEEDEGGSDDQEKGTPKDREKGGSSSGAGKSKSEP